MLVHFYHDVKKMSRLAVGMLRDALDCFDRIDLAGAAAVAERDGELDTEFQMALRDLVSYVLEDQRHLRNTLQTVYVIKALERVGDLARDIADDTQRPVRRGEQPEATTPEESREMSTPGPAAGTG